MGISIAKHDLIMREMSHGFEQRKTCAGKA
jgi:hypothetical protein